MESAMPTFSNNSKYVDMDVNNLLSSINKVEDRKRKLETEIVACTNEEVKKKKEEMLENSSRKIDESYSEV